MEDLEVVEDLEIAEVIESLAICYSTEELKLLGTVILGFWEFGDLGIWEYVSWIFDDLWSRSGGKTSQPVSRNDVISYQERVKKEEH